MRCSGPHCLDIYTALCPGKAIPKPRFASVRPLFSPQSAVNGGELLDAEALVLYFPAPNSVTGEDVLEFHVHGGNATVRAVLAAIPAAHVQSPALQPLVRYAEPGEFTRRAFYHGRLDLTQVEALGDSLAAETEQQRRLAVRGMSNSLQRRYEGWRNMLLAARGELEALIDFSEDQHFDDSPTTFTQSVAAQIVELQSQISASLRNAARGELLRSGIKIALLGTPNAGKSSLLNLIVGREAAIVSAEAGTTRDVIDINVDIGGFFCRFSDLAGMRTGSDKGADQMVGDIEREGIRRAKMNALSADIVVVVTPFQQDTATGPGHHAVLDANIADFLRSQTRPEQKILHVLNKADLIETPALLYIEEFVKGFDGLAASSSAVFPLSCLVAVAEPYTPSSDASGLQSFLNGLTKALKELTAAEEVDLTGAGIANDATNRSFAYDESLGSTERQRRLLEQCSKWLDQFLTDVRGNDESSAIKNSTTGEDQPEEVDIVLAAERLRAAAECLAKITGRGEGGDVEEVLGVVFERFCVGK